MYVTFIITVKEETSQVLIFENLIELIFPRYLFLWI